MYKRHFSKSHLCKKENKKEKKKNQPNYRLNSSLPISPLRRTLMLELLLRRLLLRFSAGSAGLNPLARACRFNTSVRLTTPTRRPDNRAPGRADAGIDGVRGAGFTYGPAVDWPAGCTWATGALGDWGGDCALVLPVG
jgi:hypothetical protein